MDLGRHVVLVEAEPLGRHRERPHGLAGREPLEVRDAHLDYEAPAGLEMLGDVAEARHLLVWVVRFMKGSATSPVGLLTTIHERRGIIGTVLKGVENAKALSHGPVDTH